MKVFCWICLFLVAYRCEGQVWQVEVMPGVAVYNGDLTQSALPFKRLKPSLSLNLKYGLTNSVMIRGGISWGQIGADDKDNRQADLKARNFSFKSNLLEANIGMEINLLEPEYFLSYPYFFGGVGVFHFNPYTYDDDNQKVFLRPLSTEGEGLPQYPNRKPYALTQFCLPFGAGYKWVLNSKWEVSYEFGYRLIFTDYLDDVSKTYIDPEILQGAKGPQASALSYRRKAPFDLLGQVRGNSKVKDNYYFSGIKLTLTLGSTE